MTSWDDICKDDKYMHVMSLNNLTEAGYFDNFGNLTAAGKAAYWQEVNTLMRKFDYYEIELKPFQEKKNKFNKHGTQGHLIWSSSQSPSHRRANVKAHSSFQRRDHIHSEVDRHQLPTPLGYRKHSY